MKVQIRPSLWVRESEEIPPLLRNFSLKMKNDRFWKVRKQFEGNEKGNSFGKCLTAGPLSGVFVCKLLLSVYVTQLFKVIIKHIFIFAVKLKDINSDHATNNP